MSASESRSVLVLELAEEFLECYRKGQRPSLKEYIERHPELAAEIQEVFPAMALMENIALDDESLREDAADQATAAAPPEQLGDFRILREVGHGGMGIVYEAEQVSLGRHVALKVLPRTVLLDVQQKRRFEREAKAAAKLHHTNIVPVFGVGEHDGLPYYVMQFIQGLGLDELLAELKRLRGVATPSDGEDERRIARKDVSVADVARSLMTGVSLHTRDTSGESNGRNEAESGDGGQLADSFTLSSSSVNLPGSAASPDKGKKSTFWQSVAQIGVQVAGALDYAHKQGIQHRDIKPSNLLLDTHGTVWVTDFGLARADNEDHLTRTGDIVGTLRYMPPEAFEGRTDARGDLYSLGLTLYELLALRPAFEEKNRRRLIKQVTTIEPARLEKRNRAIPRDLVTIVHKAIDREPVRRYQTAGELAADLQRFLDDEPIRARPLSNAERLLRWGRRNKSVAVLSTIAVLLLVVVAVVASFSAARLKQERDAVLAEQSRANKAERERLADSVEALLTASPDSVPLIVETLNTGKQAVLPNLAQRVQRPGQATVARLRLNAALALLGEDRSSELCALTAETPSEESFHLLLGMKKGDRAATVRELFSRFQRAKAGDGRTRLAIALLELGDPRAAQTELALTANLTERMRFIHLFSTWHGDLAAVPNLLRAAKDVAFRSGLCLAVADVPPAKLAPSTRRDLDDVLIELYTSAPDGGTHGAADCALRRRGLALPSIPSTQGPIQGRHWFVNRQGMTLIAVEPGWFHPREYDRPAKAAGRPPQTIVLTLPFFMGDQEVTAEWYRRFLRSSDHPKGEELTDAIRQADLRHALAIVNWRGAILFCNWLSRAEGRMPCYRLAAAEREMICDLTASGYRLPTDAEWEHAFRCGTASRFFVGEDVARMLEYGRVFATAAGPGKCFFPNPRGLFDMLGNAWEICWDQGISHDAAGLRINPVGAVGSRYAIRGGTAEAGLFYMHGSARTTNNIEKMQAFRVVCGPQNAEDAKSEAALTALRQAVKIAPNHAEAHDSLAWLLLTGPKELRDPAQALVQARKAVKLAPKQYAYQNTLGVALYHNGRFADAVPVLERCLRESKEENGAFDLFFLALCHHRLGDTAKAKECRDRAVRWFQGNRDKLFAYQVQELTVFQAETDAVLAQPPDQAK